MKHLKRIFIWLALAASAFAGVPFQMASTNGISDPRAIGNLQAWYDFSDASTLSTTTAQFTGTGTATAATNSTAFTGSSTIFLSELAAGDTVYNNSGTLIGTIQSVTNNTNAVLTANGAVAITGAAYKIQKANPRIILASDKSGVSNPTAFVMPGVGGNYGSTPNSSALQITGNLDYRAKLMMPSWTTGSGLALAYKKDNAANQRSYAFFVTSTGGLRLQMSADGSTNTQVDSTATMGFAAFSTNWVRVTRVQSSGVVTFYTSSDGSSWSQLGNTVTSITSALFVNTVSLFIGSDNLGTSTVQQADLFYLDLRNNVLNDGTGIVFQADFTTVSKLATSFTETSSNAATVTINQSTADQPARIIGVRDLYQATAGKQPTLSANGATFNGSTSYLRSPPYALIQPETILMTGQQITWTNGNYLFDGTSANTMGVQDTTSTPQINMTAGTSVAANTSFTLGATAVVAGVFNGASSALRVNRGTATTGNAGAGNPNGITLGCSGGITGGAKMTANEILIYTAALSTAQQDSLVLYGARKWSLSIAP